MPTLYKVLSGREKLIWYGTFIFPALALYFAFQVSNAYINTGYSTLAGILLLISIIPVITFLIIADRKYRRLGKKKRRAFSEDTKQFVLNRQDYHCNICGTSMQYWDFDHIGSRNDNSPENCQALCLNCHREKTVSEKRNKKRL